MAANYKMQKSDQEKTEFERQGDRRSIGQQEVKDEVKVGLKCTPRAVEWLNNVAIGLHLQLQFRSDISSHHMFQLAKV